MRFVVSCTNLNEERDGKRCIHLSEQIGQASVTVTHPSSESTTSFTFDSTLSTLDSSPSIVFSALEAPTLIDGLFSEEPQDAAIVAYGQSGSGKTYSMLGQDNQGLFAKTYEELASRIQAANLNNPSKILSLKCSFIQIYSENITDLLQKGSYDTLNVRESVTQGVFIKDLNIVDVPTSEEFAQVLKEGNLNFLIGITRMSQRSSRMSKLLTFYVIDSTKPESRPAHFYLIDLAASDRISKVNQSGQALNEMVKISQTLGTFVNVLTSLAQGNKFVPYRDSKLTRILTSALKAKRIALLATIRSGEQSYIEALQTLRLASRCKTLHDKLIATQLEQQQLLAQMEAIKISSNMESENSEMEIEEHKSSDLPEQQQQQQQQLLASNQLNYAEPRQQLEWSDNVQDQNSLDQFSVILNTLSQVKQEAFNVNEEIISCKHNVKNLLNILEGANQ